VNYRNSLAKKLLAGEIIPGSKVILDSKDGKEIVISA
jgi:hypothetical protein